MAYEGGSSNSLKQEFEERKRYKETLRPLSAYLIDTWYQFPNYGFLNNSFEPVTVVPSENYENLSTFGDYAPPGQRVLPFVAKAFNNFRDVFLSRAQTPNFTIPSHFGNLIPTKTFERFEVLYEGYVLATKQKMPLFSQSGMSNDVLLKHVLDNIKTFPITQSGFALSRHCPISTTGLAIELADLSYSFDSVKIDIIKNNTFKCFLEDATASGFLIDKNNPWRMIANLQSQPMKELLREYKEDTKPEYVMARFFQRKIHFEDFQSVYNFFNKNLTIDELFSYTVDIRMAETNMGEDKSLKEKIVKEITDIYNLYSSNYPSDPFKGSSAILGKYCSQQLARIYSSKAEINTYSLTTIKDYL